MFIPRPLYHSLPPSLLLSLLLLHHHPLISSGPLRTDALIFPPIQLEIVPPPSSPPHVQCWEGGGHFVHEDNAEGVASMIIHFLSRHNL